MNYSSGGDAASPVGVVKATSGRGRGRVKLNAPTLIAASSVTAPPQQQRPAAMVPVPRDREAHSNASQKLGAGDYRRQRGEKPQDSQVQKPKEQACESVTTARSSRRAGIAPHSSKSDRQIYRPPVFRAADARRTVGTSGLRASAPMKSGSRDRPMRSLQPATANGGGGVSNSAPWNAAISKGSLKRSPLSSSVPAETPMRQQRQQAVNNIKGAQQPNPCSSQEEIDPASTPSEKLVIIKKALTDPDGLNAFQMQWLGLSICERVTKGSNDAASAVKFCTSLIKRGRTSAFLDGLLESCNDCFKRREKLLPRCTARTPSATQNPGSPSRSWTAFVSFLAELLAAVSEMESSALYSGQISCLASLLCECCYIIIRATAQDTTAEMQCLRFVFMTAGKSIQRVAPYLSASLANCLRDSFLDSNRSADVRQALLQLIEFRASGWKLGVAQQLYYSALDSGAAVTD